MPVSALTYQERSSAMIQYFAGENADANLTDDDVRMFGIYISNFYEPFTTNIYDKKPVEDAIAKLMGGNIPASAQAFADTLTQSVLANIMENSKELQSTGIFI